MIFVFINCDTKRNAVHDVPLHIHVRFHQLILNVAVYVMIWFVSIYSSLKLNIVLYYVQTSYFCIHKLWCTDLIYLTFQEWQNVALYNNVWTRLMCEMFKDILDITVFINWCTELTCFVHQYVECSTVYNVWTRVMCEKMF